jgi:hypothetical protein
MISIDGPKRHVSRISGLPLSADSKARACLLPALYATARLLRPQARPPSPASSSVGRTSDGKFGKLLPNGRAANSE